MPFACLFNVIVPVVFCCRPLQGAWCNPVDIVYQIYLGLPAHLTTTLPFHQPNMTLVGRHFLVKHVNLQERIRQCAIGIPSIPKSQVGILTVSSDVLELPLRPVISFQVVQQCPPNLSFTWVKLPHSGFESLKSFPERHLTSFPPSLDNFVLGSCFVLESDRIPRVLPDVTEAVSPYYLLIVGQGWGMQQRIAFVTGVKCKNTVLGRRSASGTISPTARILRSRLSTSPITVCRSGGIGSRRCTDVGVHRGRRRKRHGEVVVYRASWVREVLVVETC
jgi:hypothetical protein